jgi:hypothetical protein
MEVEPVRKDSDRTKPRRRTEESVQVKSPESAQAISLAKHSSRSPNPDDKLVPGHKTHKIKVSNGLDKQNMLNLSLF